MHDQISDFVKQMSNSPFAPQIPRSPVKSSVGKSSKDQYNIAKSYKVKDGTSPAIMKNKNQLKPKKDKFAPTAMNEDDETDEDDDKEDDGNSSSGEEENEKNDEKNEEKQNDNEDEEMDGDEENDGGEVPPVGDGKNYDRLDGVLKPTKIRSNTLFTLSFQDEGCLTMPMKFIF